MKIELCELADVSGDVVCTYSPFCQKIHRALQLHGLEYVRRHGARPDSWKQFNPRGQVPVLLVDGEPVADSTVILRRLEESSEHSLVPDDPAARAEAWITEEYADVSLNGFVVAARWADETNWERTREELFGGMPAPLRWFVPDRVRSGVLDALVARDFYRGSAGECWDRFRGQLDVLETRAPARGFWVGSRPSVADVALFGQLQSLRASLTPWQKGEIEARSGLTAYLDRVAGATPAAVRGVAA